MTVSLGYLLPTRELCMAGVPETRSILALADRAEALGLDSPERACAWSNTSKRRGRSNDAGSNEARQR